LATIAAFADDNTQPTPTVADYAAAGVTGVTAANLTEVNAAVDAVVGTAADTVPEIQGLVDPAIALDKIEAYADDNTNPAPTVADYTAAGVTGVTAANLTDVNAAVDAVVGTAADTVPEVQGLVDPAIALHKIAARAYSNGNPAPTVADYAAAGVTGVTAANLAGVDAAVKAVYGTVADTVPEVQALVDAVDALDKIEAFADDNTQPTPTVADYAAAGVTGVTAANLTEVNAAVDAVVGTAADTRHEVQGLVGPAIALNKIAAYADDNTQPAPTVADYAAAGVTGVTAANLTDVNAAIDAVVGAAADTAPEIQGLIDGTKAPALAKIAAYADDNTQSVPTVADYAAAGVRGVSAANLTDVNAAVDAVVGAEADTTPEVQGLVDGTLIPSGTTATSVISNMTDGTAKFTVGDMNNDGHIDIITSSIFDDSVNVFLNDGSGSFGTPTLVADNVTFARDVAVGDVNGDGHLDIAAAATHRGSYLVYLSDGAGGYGSEIVVDTGIAEAFCVEFADLNLDGNLDLVTSSGRDNEVKIYFGDGSGGFDTQVELALDSVGSAYIRLVDLNDDGNLDVMAANTGANVVSTFFNNGDGTFQTALASGTFQDVASTSSASRFDTFDVNGDGILDLVASTNYGGVNEASLFIGNGDGTFGEQSVMFTSPGVVDQIDFLDFNNDGNIDIMIGTQFELNLLVGYGDGTFSEGTNIKDGYVAGGAVADLNNDGLQDYIASYWELDEVAIFTQTV
jgi:hypothetical protein